MPKAKRKKPQTINFDEYLARLMQLKGEALLQWNRESTRRSNLLQREISEKSKGNIERFLQTPDAEASLIEQRNHSGEITVNWNLHMGNGECLLRVRVGDTRSEFGLFGHPILNRISAKRFTLLIEEQLIAAALSLFEACAIYSAEKIQKTNPRYWRDRFMNEAIRRLEMLSAKPKDTGRPKNTTKNCLQKEDAARDIRANVLLAIKNLYEGKSTDTHQCSSNHKQDACSGHDIEEINISLVASYLNMQNSGTLRNQLSKHGLKFRELKTTALSKITY